MWYISPNYMLGKYGKKKNESGVIETTVSPEPIS